MPTDSQGPLASGRACRYVPLSAPEDICRIMGEGERTGRRSKRDGYGPPTWCLRWHLLEGGDWNRWVWFECRVLLGVGYV